MNEHPISAILLAAGLSSRMDGENKMLLPFQETIVIQHTYNQLVECDLAEIIVVGGKDFHNLHRVLRLRDSDRLIVNPSYMNGMTSSIQAGVNLANGDAYMICLGDMPLLTYLHYLDLMSFYKDRIYKDPAAIALPKVNDKRGNPVIFSNHYREEILTNDQPNGCKSVIANNNDHLVLFESDQTQYLNDIDTPEDYKRLLHEPQ